MRRRPHGTEVEAAEGTPQRRDEQEGLPRVVCVCLCVCVSFGGVRGAGESLHENDYLLTPCYLLLAT